MSQDNYEDALFGFIKRSEGLRLKPYKDIVGKWTVFYGRNLEAVATTSEEILALFFHGNTVSVAELFLKNDIKRAEEDCRVIFLQEFEGFDAPRKIALTSVMFNLGLRRFRSFKKMILAVKARRWDDAHDELLDSLRARQCPGRSKEEAEMLKIGRSCGVRKLS